MSWSLVHEIDGGWQILCKNNYSKIKNDQYEISILFHHVSTVYIKFETFGSKITSTFNKISDIKGNFQFLKQWPHVVIIHNLTKKFKIKGKIFENMFKTIDVYSRQDLGNFWETNSTEFSW